MRPVRVFLAVELSDEMRETLRHLQDNLRQHMRLRGVQWVRPESLHVTVKFLGEIEEPQAEVIHDLLQPVLTTQSPFFLDAAELGVFPGVRSPRVLWVGFHGAGTDAMIRLVQEVESALTRIGIAPEGRPYQPHLTLARIKEQPREVGGRLQERELLGRTARYGTLPVERLSLMKSDLRPFGAVYTRLWACALTGPSGPLEPYS